MLITGLEIKKQIQKGNIVIEDFDEKRLNPNSYNLRLSNKMKIYEMDKGYLDMKEKSKVKEIIIPEDGYLLVPGKFYLASSIEYTETHKHAPMIEGRSSIGRLGMQVHGAAGFGDVGFKGKWTLHVTVKNPIKVYPGVEIAQIYYFEVKGDLTNYNSEKYQGQDGPTESKIYKDFK